MCTCTSCEYTDSPPNGATQGFAGWPRGNPTGPRRAQAEYAAHVAHSKIWGRSASGDISLGPAIPDSLRVLHPEPRFSASVPNGYAHPIEQNAIAVRWNAGKGQISKGPENPAPARPAEPCKAPRHFPEADRSLGQSARIYEMAKAKKRPVGRPPLEGAKRVLVSLDRASLERGRALGAGNLSAGIRRALAKAQSG